MTEQDCSSCKLWGHTSNGENVYLFNLCNPKSSRGIKVTLTNYGARIVSILAPDRDGKLENIVAGYQNVSDYWKEENANYYFGCIVGRYANRIDKGQFVIDGEVFNLATNNTPGGKPCSLHGGLVGFDKVVWKAESQVVDDHNIQCEQSVTFTYISPDGEEGFPGELTVSVNYSIDEDDTLSISYTATTKFKPTIINLSNHSYFNLSGFNRNVNILNHKLKLNASRYTPVNEGLIPTGDIASVINTPLDFTQGKNIGTHINEKHPQLDYCNGYDHNYVIDREDNDDTIMKDLVLAARVADSQSGRVLEVFTTEPGIQFYTGNFLPTPSTTCSASTSCSGNTNGFYYRSAFCLETQHFPDSPNRPSFPSTILRIGETFHSKTKYRFSVM